MLTRICRRCKEPIAIKEKVYTLTLIAEECPQNEDLSLNRGEHKALGNNQYEYCSKCYKEQCKLQKEFFGAEPLVKVKKGRGRPKAKKTKETTGKRGRPKGSKNKKATKKSDKPIIKKQEEEKSQKAKEEKTLPKPPPPPKIPR